MRLYSACRFLLIVAMIAAPLAPDHAQARAGGGGSFGSRGTRTYHSTPYAQPVQRSATQPGNSSAPYTPPGASHPFLSGIAGGMLGMGLAHMLFGGGGFGGGGFGLMHLLLLGGLVYFGMRFWRARQAAQGNYGAFPQAGATANPMRGFAGNFMGSAVDTGTPLMLADTDTEAFAQTLVSIQTAWGDGNFDKLRQYVTPEMLHYFNDELAANTSRGVENKVANVTVQDVQAVESWQEYNLSYATVVIRWTASDYMVRLGRQPADSDYIASGNPAASETFSEQWTFNRAQGGRWLLSAIQQVV